MQAWRLYLRDDNGMPENHCRNKDLFLSSSTPVLDVCNRGSQSRIQGFSFFFVREDKRHWIPIGCLDPRSGRGQASGMTEASYFHTNDRFGRRSIAYHTGFLIFDKTGNGRAPNVMAKAAS